MKKITIGSAESEATEAIATVGAAINAPRYENCCTTLTIQFTNNGLNTLWRLFLLTSKNLFFNFGFANTTKRSAIPVPNSTKDTVVTKFWSALLSLTNKTLPMIAIKTYKNAYITARILTLRDLFRVVKIIKNGADSIIINATNCIGENV